MTVLIYHSRLRPEAPGVPPHWMAGLPSAKRAELLASTHAKRRWESVLGLRLLACGMATLGRTDFDLSRVHFGSAKKPSWTGDLDFSISHSGDLVACAVNTEPNAPIGLDIEWLRRTAPRALGRYLTGDEQGRTHGTRGLFELWTAKECVVKAGCGAGLARIREVELDGTGARFDGRRWFTQRIDLASGFATCVATLADPSAAAVAPAIETVHVPWSELEPDERAAGQAS